MLSKKQVEQFHRDGYTVFPGFLDRDEVDAFLKDAEEACVGNTFAQHDKTRLEMEPDQPPEGTKVRRLYDPCTNYPSFRSLPDSDKLLDCVEQLFGPNLVFHYSKLNMKPSAIGSIVEWHQDLSYYPLTNCDSLAVLFYLDDADSGNGALQIIPGRHLGPLLDHTLEGFFVGKITEHIDESQAVPVEGKAGTAIFMHGMTPHSSAPNRSRRPRRTLILSYRAADAFPIYLGENTVRTETHARLVRGKQPNQARLTLTEFPIPRYRWKFVSLYEVQELSRKGYSK